MPTSQQLTLVECVTSLAVTLTLDCVTFPATPGHPHLLGTTHYTNRHNLSYYTNLYWPNDYTKTQVSRTL